MGFTKASWIVDQVSSKVSKFASNGGGSKHFPVIGGRIQSISLRPNAVHSCKASSSVFSPNFSGLLLCCVLS